MSNKKATNKTNKNHKDNLLLCIQKVSKELEPILFTEHYQDAYKKSVLLIMIESIRIKNKPTTYIKNSILLIKRFGYETVRTLANIQKIPSSTMALKVKEIKKMPYHAYFIFNNRKYYQKKYITEIIK